METVYQLAGVIILVLFAAGFAAACIAWAFERATNWWDRKLREAVDREIRRRGEQMAHQHYWFHPIDQAAMWIACSEALRSGSYPDAGYIRDRILPEHVKRITAQRDQNHRR